MRVRERRWRRSTRDAEQGLTVLAVLLAMTLLLALAGGVLQVTTTEARIAAHHRDGLDARYAAESFVERIRAELRDANDIGLLLNGPWTSSLADGPSAGHRTIPGAAVDLNDLTNMELCARITSCSEAALRAETPERPWGANNPRWRLYAHAWMRQAIESTAAPAIYVVAWIGDDPAETDGDPLRDGSGPGQGRIALRVRAYGAHGARREIDVIIGGVPRRPHVVTWVER